MSEAKSYTGVYHHNILHSGISVIRCARLGGGLLMTAAAWEQAYVTRFENSHFGDDAIGLFALGLKFGIDDLEAVGTEGIVGGGDDKKCDFSRKPHTAAPANKASDLNTAITWLLITPIQDFAGTTEIKRR
jgi:hypothetical protein